MSTEKRKVRFNKPAKSLLVIDDKSRSADDHLQWLLANIYRVGHPKSVSVNWDVRRKQQTTLIIGADGRIMSFWCAIGVETHEASNLAWLLNHFSFPFEVIQVWGEPRLMSGQRTWTRTEFIEKELIDEPRKGQA